MPVVSIWRDPRLAYPPDDNFSPKEVYPESTSNDINPTGGNVYQSIRECLRAAGADAGHFGEAGWNPLGDWIERGDRVFVLPNLVFHRRPGESAAAFQAKCTHASVLRPILDYAMLAAGNPGLVSFGNAPLQSCDYQRVAQDTGAHALAEYYRDRAGVHVGPRDLRGLTATWTRFGTLVGSRDTKEEVVYVDLERDSLLDGLAGHGNGEFRVGDYDGEKTASFHFPGHHVYAMNRRVLDAKVVVSVPKLKTHQKVGMTCCIKGTVGSIARKECLAHHRKGGPGEGGDEYAHSTQIRRVLSGLNDRAAAGRSGLGDNALRLMTKSFTHMLERTTHTYTGGAWYGNDTAWRMALDIARIILFAGPDGKLHDEPQRRHIGFVDAIVAGEGDGPLRPSARRLGTLAFADDVCILDYFCALLMGFDPARIPTVRHSFLEMRYPPTRCRPESAEIVQDGKPATIGRVGRESTGRLQPAPGWVGHIEFGDAAETVAE